MIVDVNKITIKSACAGCYKIKVEGTNESWITPSKMVLKTTEKLSLCGKCHFEQYCSTSCQKKQWNEHKRCCVQSPKRISASKILKIVKNSCPMSSGCFNITFDDNLDFQTIVENKKRKAERDKIITEVYIRSSSTLKSEKCGDYHFVLCSPNIFDWKSELEDILNPPNQIHNPGAMIDLGLKMIRQGLCEEAFIMMRDRTPRGYNILQDMFFRQAALLAKDLKIDKEFFVSCAKLINKNREEVNSLVDEQIKIPLPKKLQNDIKEAEILDYGKRDLKMEGLAFQILELGDYNEAFKLVFDWIALEPIKNVFFGKAVELLINNKTVSYEKIVQLGKSIHLSEDVILNAVIPVYALTDTKFACELANKTKKADYYLELVFTALLLEKRFEEAKTILEKVSPNKRIDLKRYL